ncbi:MAG: hypothetical protein GX442_02925 [Candidatus Riflebacteria bacterium]|nr:hypothetical protein [Candidatus Riflebacteria bacterium]
MRNQTIKLLSKVMAVVLIATFAFEAPLLAAYESINVNVAGQNVAVTPGQWVTVKQGTQTVHYNVRYMDGKPVALEMSQYMKLIFGGESAAAATTAASSQAATSGATSQATTAGTSKVTTTGTSKVTTPSSGNLVSQSQSTAGTGKLGTVADNSAAAAAGVEPSVAAPQTMQADAATSGAAQSGTKSSGSWIKNELSEYGSKIKDSFQSGKETGNNFGTKTVDGAKNGLGKVGTAVKSTGSKIGDLLRGAKERIAKIFHKNTPAKTDAAKGGDASQSGQSGQSGDQGQSGQSGQSEQGSQAGQSEQSGQSGQSGQSEQGSQAGQSEQSGQVSQGQEGAPATGDAGQSGQSGQASGEKKPGFFDKTGEKFKAGYSKGKEMVGQGVTNVKESLKSGFSPKNLLMTAGITVGVDLATQIIKGEKPSLKKALKTVVSAEFAGGVVGSVTGAAAGSFFVPFLSAVPVVGGVLSALAPTFGSIVGGSVGAYLAGDLKNGRFSIKQAFKSIDWVGVAGQTVGSTLGTMLGSMIFPPFGTIIGGIVGGMVGNWAAHKIAGLFGKGGSTNVAMPVGSNPLAGDAGQGSVTIGSVAGSSEIPVSGDAASSAEVTIAGDAAETVGTYASEVQLAYAKYQELYRLYNELLAQGRQADAVKVAAEMNKAKAEYDALKAKSK